MRPTVGVIVINYNGRQYLDDCLGSLLDVRYPAERLSIVLADNGSTDGSREYAAGKFPGVKVTAFGENLGFAAGNNRAAAGLSTDYVMMLNNDTVVRPDTVDLLVDACEAGAGCAGARIVSWDEARTLWCGGTINFLGTGIPRTAAPETMEPFETLFACGCGMLMRRDRFIESGGFDEEFFMFAEDVDLGWRLNLFGMRVVAVPAAVIRHFHGGTLDSTATAFHKSLSIRNPMLAMVKNYEETNLKRALPAALMLAMSRVMSHLGVEGHDEGSLSAFERKLAAGRPADRAALVMAMANLSALHGFFGLLEGAMKRREGVQARRMISDEEIARRFKVTLGYDGYMDASNYGVSLLRLARFFDVSSLLSPAGRREEVYEQLDRLDAYIAKLSTRLRTVEDELDKVHASRSWRLISRLFGLTRRLGVR